jgi:hypothetical protein
LENKDKLIFTVLKKQETKDDSKKKHHYKFDQVTSVEQVFKHITIVGGGNAAGTRLPTMLIFDGKSVPKVSPT